MRVVCPWVTEQPWQGFDLLDLYSLSYLDIWVDQLERYSLNSWQRIYSHLSITALHLSLTSFFPSSLPIPFDMAISRLEFSILSHLLPWYHLISPLSLSSLYFESNQWSLHLNMCLLEHGLMNNSSLMIVCVCL